MADLPIHNVDEYKRRLGYGARLNLFRCELEFPFGTAGDREEFIVFCEAVNMVPPRAMAATSIPFQGDFFNIAGDKAANPEITITFKNAENFKLRQAFKQWMDTMQQDITGLRTSPALYKSNMKVIQMDHLKNPIKIMQYLGIFPLSLTGMDLSNAATDISSTSVTMAFDTQKELPLITG